MSTEVILVNELDEQVGTMEKMEAHLQGVLHRAFSVLLFNSKGEMLIHKRAKDKYHSGGLWSNACCSHPLPGELVSDAAIRRLNEELHITIPSVKSIGHILYHLPFENGLIEHEFDHVFTAEVDSILQWNTDEIEEVRYISMDQLKDEVSQSPQQFTGWFKIILKTFYSN